jgi:hypothetical protein
MTLKTQRPPGKAGAAGEVHSLGSKKPSRSAPAPETQAKIVAFPRTPGNRPFIKPPAPLRLAVQFHTFHRHAPHGISRRFCINDRDLSELFAAAERLESRA